MPKRRHEEERQTETTETVEETVETPDQPEPDQPEERPEPDQPDPDADSGAPQGNDSAMSGREAGATDGDNSEGSGPADDDG